MDYRNIQRDSIQNNPRIVDIAMLGAHDAFSSRINRSNPINPADGGIANNKTLRLAGGGLMARFARAQKFDAHQLGIHGVRYFDVRISHADGVWWTEHVILSGTLDEYIGGLLRFLGETENEGVIIDVARAHTGDQGMEALLQYLVTGIQYEGKSLKDYIDYEPATAALGDLRYRDITRKGTRVILLAKAPVSSASCHFPRDDSIRSTWHDKNTAKEMLSGIDGEYQALRQDTALARNMFRVNQAQKTSSTDGDKIIASIFQWGLLDMANRFNPVLVNHQNFDRWLTVMPIFMVDYADSMRGSFNDKVIARINEFNRNLF
jgi:hypothetical protein